jgi:ribosomal protein S18 acetylase RimI-like enzyme
MTNGITQTRATSGLADNAARRPTDAAGTVPITVADDDMAARLIERAFHPDPMMLYLAPDEPSRSRRSLPFFASAIRYCRGYGIAEMTTNKDGVALWIKPGNTSVTLGRMLRTGVLFAPLKLGLSGMGRFNTLMSYGDKLHKQAMSGDQHWYLLTIGVEPSRQRTGVGGRLLNAGLQRADADGLACYLETANPDNLPFYRRHGFEVAADGEVSKGGLHVWAMVRR